MVTKARGNVNLPAIELFADLPVADCQKILGSAREQVFRPFEVIFHAGDARKSIFLLLEGRVKITRRARTSDEVILSIHGPGQIVGSLVLSAESTYAFGAQAIETCQVAVWDLATFEACMEQYPLLVRRVQRIIARQYGELSSRIREISTELSEARLASEIVRLAPQIGAQVDGCFELNVSQKELAQMTAMSHYTANRQFREWEREGLVQRRSRTIVILNLPGLRRRAAAA